MYRGPNKMRQASMTGAVQCMVHEVSGSLRGSPGQLPAGRAPLHEMEMDSLDPGVRTEQDQYSVRLRVSLIDSAPVRGTYAFLQMFNRGHLSATCVMAQREQKTVKL